MSRLGADHSRLAVVDAVLGCWCVRVVGVWWYFSFSFSDCNLLGLQSCDFFPCYISMKHRTLYLVLFVKKNHYRI